MVFGWGRKKKQKIEDRSPDGGSHYSTDGQDTPASDTKSTIHLADVSGIIDEIDAVRQDRIISDGRRIKNQTQPLIDELIKIGNVLEKDDLNVDDVDKHIGTIVIRGKKQLIGAIKKDVVHLPDVTDMASVRKLDTVLGAILKKVGDVLGRQSNVIHIFAKKYANQLKANLEVMATNSVEIHEILERYDVSQAEAKQIIQMVDEVGAIGQKRIMKIQKIKEIALDVAGLDEKMSEMRDSIKVTKSSDDYKKYLDMCISLEGIKSQMASIRGQINAEFAKISRPLGRYEYQSALDKEYKMVLKTLTVDPSDAFSTQNTDAIIMILHNIAEGVSSGSISVKDVDRTISQVTQISDSVKGYVQRIVQNRKDHGAMQARIAAQRPDGLDGMELDLAKSISLRDGLAAKSTTITDELDKMNQSEPMLVAKIQDMLTGHTNSTYIIIPKLN